MIVCEARSRKAQSERNSSVVTVDLEALFVNTE